MIDLKEFEPSNHVKPAATCLLSISSSLMEPEHSDAYSSVLTHDYMQHKALVDNKTVNLVIGEVYPR